MNLQAIRKQMPQIEKELAAVLDKYNITLVKMGGSIGADDSTFKLTVTDKGANPNAKYAKNFEVYAELYGLKREWLNQSFKASQGNFTIIGYDTKKRKKPVMLKLDRDGKTYFAPESMVALYMKAK